MKYQGGKHRLSKPISGYIHKYMEQNQHLVYYEPFVGSGAVLEKVDAPVKIASDIDGDLIAFWQALQKGWEPPKSITEEEYKQYRDNPKSISPELRCFVSVFCSFSAKKWGGYARGKNRDYALEAHKGALKRVEKVMDSWFIHIDYRNINPRNAIIYCDPPYKGTTPYRGIDFDTDEFWDIMARWKQNNNTILVSEITAPSNVECIWSKDYQSSTQELVLILKELKTYILYSTIN